MSLAGAAFLIWYSWSGRLARRNQGYCNPSSSPAPLRRAPCGSPAWVSGRGLLAPLLSKPKAWRGIEALVAAMMFAIAAKLLAAGAPLWVA
jgi:arginine exporter protein ArgO